MLCGWDIGLSREKLMYNISMDNQFVASVIVCILNNVAMILFVLEPSHGTLLLATILLLWWSYDTQPWFGSYNVTRMILATGMG